MRTHKLDSHAKKKVNGKRNKGKGGRDGQNDHQHCGIAISKREVINDRISLNVCGKKYGDE